MASKAGVPGISGSRPLVFPSEIKEVIHEYNINLDSVRITLV